MSGKEQWAVVEEDEAVHVLPLEPPEHEQSDRCWCDPAVERHSKPLIIHNRVQ